MQEVTQGPPGTSCGQSHGHSVILTRNPRRIFFSRLGVAIIAVFTVFVSFIRHMSSPLERIPACSPTSVSSCHLGHRGSGL